MTCDVAETLLEDRVREGIIVNTDSHRAYARVMRGLKVAFHDAAASTVHGHLERLDNIHSVIRGFLHPFNGVSTKWLSGYLAWFKWLRGYREAEDLGIGAARRQLRTGDYEHVRRRLCDIPLPLRDMGLRPTKT
jgi:hypothetical protein